MKPFTSLVLLLVSLMMVSGCALVGVDYDAPQISTPDAWTASVSSDLKPRSASIERWWRGFRDPVLNELIERTRAGNRDLRVASQRIAEARSLRRVAQSPLLPAVTGSSDVTRSRSSESLGGPVPGNPSNLFSAGFDMNWEIDVFGGLRRNIEAADAQLGSTTEAFRDLLVSLFAETALNYVEYRTTEERIRLAEANIADQEDSVTLTQTRLDLGLAPRIDVNQATGNLETSRALIPQLRTQRTQARNRLAALAGGYPEDLTNLLNRQRPIPSPEGRLSTGLPTDLIRARADVRRAERNLAAATANIGVAEADLYPRFSLFGRFQLQSLESSDLIDGASRAYSFGPSIKWNVFNAGRIRNNIRIEESRTEQALTSYEQAVILAVEEVENSMAAIANERDRQAALRRAVAASTSTVSLVKGNYKEGLIDFQRVLDAERSKFNSEDQAAVSRGQIASNHVSLYKALGGGSEVEVVPITEPKPPVRESSELSTPPFP